MPLKYPGLKPWEIFLSESQERFTLAVEPARLDELLALGREMEVELTDIGFFNAEGSLDVLFDGKPIAGISLEFLHDGVPRKTLLAEYVKPAAQEPVLPPSLDYNDVLLKLLGSLNICSRESVIRQYDHEVKGRTIVKPLMGATGQAPQDAAVVRFNFESWEGVAVSNGILPRMGDLDAYQMSAGSFDEAVRQIISVGGKLPNLTPGDNIFWSVNDNFCVPDSVYDPAINPDGKQKMAKLVQMCQALRDACAAYCIPLTSGKDSMKNDFKADGVKISVPPTVLYSMTAKVADVRQVVTSDFKQADDVIYLLGETYNEMGGSEFYQLFGELGANVPKVDFSRAKELYILVGEANDQQLIQSSHDLSDGGLAVALAECTFGRDSLGADLDLSGVPGELSAAVLLFSESHSRFVVSVAPEDVVAFESILEDRATRLGRVTADGQLRVQYQGQELLNGNITDLRAAWTNGPVNQTIGLEPATALHS